MKQFIISLLVLNTILIMSCEKSSQNELLEKESIDLGLNHLSLVNDAIENVALSAPTRKAVRLTVTDLETGKTETFFDCTQPGGSCDVGEELPPPGSVTSLVASRKSLLLSNAELKKNVAQGNIQFEEGKDYLALKSAENGDILYVYKALSEDYANAQVKEVAKYKKGKINTETNKLECLEDGSNCKVSNETVEPETSELTAYISLAKIDNYFPNLDLPNKIENGDYSLYRGRNFTMIKPENPLHETYYVQK